MPTYDYRCTACKHEFEQYQSMKDKALRKCPACGKAALERLIGTGAAIIFKGSGFYQTDYRSESYKKAQESDKPADASKADATKADAATKPEVKADGKAKPETKPDSKPETKASAKPEAKPPASSDSKPAPKSEHTSRKHRTKSDA